jgi:hypothetical protein
MHLGIKAVNTKIRGNIIPIEVKTRENKKIGAISRKRRYNQQISNNPATHTAKLVNIS